MGGVVGHYVAIRRRQVLRAAREDVKQRRLQRQKPEMWDVWAQVPAPLQSQQVWRYLNVRFMLMVGEYRLQLI